MSFAKSLLAPIKDMDIDEAAVNYVMQNLDNVKSFFDNIYKEVSNEKFVTLLAKGLSSAWILEDSVNSLFKL